MKRFEFDNRKALNMANDNLKNGPTRHGAIELYPWLGPVDDQDFLSLDIRGPVKAFRGSAVIDKETARKLSAALLKWAGLNVDVDLLIKQINWLAGLGLGLCDEQEGLLNLLGALRDLMEPV